MKPFYSIFLALSLCFALTGCSDDDDNKKTPESPGEEPRATTDEIYYANQFASDLYSEVYLWNAEIWNDIPKLDPDNNTDPISTVTEIRYKENGKEVDKWSTLTNDYKSFTSSLSGIETTYGYDVALGKFSNTENYFFVITFVYEDSPAAKAGLKRGDIIITLNDQDITMDNYLDALYSANVTLGMGVLTEQGIATGGKVSLVSVQMYENPILVSKTFDCDGKKVGYLAYSSFDMISLPKLVEISKQFKAEGVTELILDLRYNGGGYVVTETAMASMYAPESEVKAKALYQTEIWNQLYTEYFQKQGEDLNTYFSTSFKIRDANNNTITVSTEGANIGLDKIYALIGPGTASASESLLIGLMPFMEIETLGSNSHGKYCTGMVLAPSDIYDKVPKEIDNWGFYIMVNRYADRNGNNPCMPDGLVPDIKVDDDLFDGYQLGDEHETMLRAALTRAGKTDFAPETRSLRFLPTCEMRHIATSPLAGKRIDTRRTELLKR